MPHTSSENVSVNILCSLTTGAAADALPDAARVSASAPARTRASFHAVAPRPYSRDAFMFPPQDGACGDEPVCTALPGWSAGAGSRELPLRDPPVKNESSAAAQSIAIACDAGRDVVDAVAASSTFGSEEDGPV